MSDPKKAPKKLTADQRKKLVNRRKQSWRQSIVAHLAAEGPKTAIEVYNATRPDRLDISDQKKQHNVASQLAYLSDDGYITIKDEGKIVLIADPDNNIYEGAEKYL